MVVSFNGSMNGTLLDGVYRLDYDVDAADPVIAAGQGVMIVRKNGVLGSDSDGGVFLGRYIWDLDRASFVVSGRFIVPPHGVLITDLASGAAGMDVEIEATGCGSRFVTQIAGRRVGIGVSYVGPLPPEFGVPPQ